MTNSITPPPELVRQWSIEAEDEHQPTVAYSMVSLLSTKAAQWGANQELEACCEWLVSEGWFKYEHEAVEDLRTARRPKPLSLKEEARQALGRFNANAHGTADQVQNDFDLLRRAVEALND